MRARIILLIFLFIAPLSFGKGILDRVISVEIVDTPIRKILRTIEDKAKVRFSYNPILIDENKRVSLSLQSKTIRYGLTLIFDETILFKEVGNHIVLLKDEDSEEVKLRRKERNHLTFSGTIYDGSTSRKIANASVYEVQTRTAVISDDNGKYELTVTRDREVRSLYFSKHGYYDTVIVVRANVEDELENDIRLRPLIEDVVKISPVDIPKLDTPIEERALSGILISNETYLHSSNLNDIEEKRWAQISLVPSLSIGSNLSTNGLIVNRISLNVLAGYSKGVEGAEFGSIMNLTRENVVGAQIAGIANLNGGDILGAQVGGIANLVQGSVTGAQIGGISTIVKRHVTGAQIAGISGICRGSFKGAQIAGISNIAFEKSIGLQIAGIHNIVRDSLYGAQIAGIGNNTKGGYNFLQISGIYNYAGRNTGLQATGIFNHARENSGLQVGLINTSRKSNGVALGLIQWVTEGYHKTEISTNETFQANITLKSGSQRFYNSYHAGVRFANQNAYAFGVGFGSYFNLGERWMLSLDATGDLVNENDFTTWEFSNLFKVSTTIDFKLAKWITLFAGPSFNAHVMMFQNDLGQYSSTITGNSVYTDAFNQGVTNLWIGGQFGIRL